ncbi:alpha/beta hydrolase [Leptospira haakeii]|uniref:Alpha/beta hydrolase n=1 Tax=Leptospira haakeii TaxID=2023198 RepID=A0ABX4PH20_9LEPT|nr:alpha/beta hydrolase [Leptospira haakeii]PKA15050.1 alpha/beta hydrolase [Leptospira haakeii]PKA20207.1 alpha/beta hydrolase [Leptospira haakeii]
MLQFGSDSKIATLPSGIRIAYRIFPGKSKVPLFCVHGLTGNLKNFEPIAQGLSKKGITVIVYDLRGRGNSDKPKEDYSARVHAQDLKELSSILGYSKISILSHSLGAWITLRFAEKFSSFLEKAVLIDGGGELSIKRKISNLLMIQGSLARLGRRIPSKEMYLQEAKKSPLLSAWNTNIQNFLLYELEPIGTLSPSLMPGNTFYGPVLCSIPPFVIDSELKNMGGAMKPGGIVARLFKDPKEFFKTLKENKIMPYSALRCPVLVIRALKPNFKPGDELLPSTAIEKMKEKILNLKVYELSDKNHYESVLLEDKERDQEIFKFLKF